MCADERAPVDALAGVDGAAASACGFAHAAAFSAAGGVAAVDGGEERVGAFDDVAAAFALAFPQSGAVSVSNEADDEQVPDLFAWVDDG